MRARKKIKTSGFALLEPHAAEQVRLMLCAKRSLFIRYLRRDFAQKKFVREDRKN